jgi:hypothetical protein
VLGGFRRLSSNWHPLRRCVSRHFGISPDRHDGHLAVPFRPSDAPLRLHGSRSALMVAVIAIGPERLDIP